MGERDSVNEHKEQKALSWRLDPADFANRIRMLAADTGRTLKGRDTRPWEFIKLSQRIDDLRQETQHPRFIEIDRWLWNARNLIERRKRSSEGTDLDCSAD